MKEKYELRWDGPTFQSTLTFLDRANAEKEAEKMPGYNRSVVRIREETLSFYPAEEV